MAKYRYQEYEDEAPRKRRKGPNGCLILVALFVALLIGLGVWGVSIINEITGSDEPGEEVTVSIAQGEGPTSIAETLAEAGVIKQPTVFRYYLRYKGAAGNLQYGEFVLQKGQSYDDIIETLSQYVRRATVTVTFPEGITAIRFAELMEENGLCTKDEFLEVANNGDFSQYDFWNAIPEDPDRFMTVSYTHLRAHETSFVQEEAGNAEDARVSAVFHNRLAEGSPFPRLESNVSSYVQNPNDNNYIYNWIAPYYGGWDNIPQNIYNAYNTYERAGLPAGPVSNPGSDALQAALYPDQEYLEEKYYFFVTDKNGKYYYAKTVNEHQNNVNTAFSVK